MKRATKWIIDTDIGDDIDDAFSIQFAVKGGLDILGVTTVFRSAYLRAELASYLLELCGRGDIPVFAGEDLPVDGCVDRIQKAQNWLPEQKFLALKGDEQWLPHDLPQMHGAAVARGRAVDFIISCAEQYGDELGILSIGPMTNLARCLAAAPAAMLGIGEIVFLGGNIEEDVAEWNVALDAAAAQAVFSSGICIRQIGSNLSWRCCATTEVEKEKLMCQPGQLGEANRLMLQKWSETPVYRGKTPCLHDLLPVLAVLSPQSFRFSEKRVRVGQEGGERGKTLPDEENGSLILSAEAVDPADYRRYLQKYILSASAVAV